MSKEPVVLTSSCRRGRPRKTWSECVKNDLSTHNLIDVNPLDRKTWCRKIKDSLALPMMQGK